MSTQEYLTLTVETAYDKDGNAYPLVKEVMVSEEEYNALVARGVDVGEAIVSRPKEAGSND